MDPHFSAWRDRARAVPIEREIVRRGIKLKRVGAELVGPCPKCGGDDRFAVSEKERIFNCRGCGAKGDVIALVQHLDNVNFNTACATLTGEPPPKANGKDRTGKPQEIVVGEYPYHDEAGKVVFATERIEYQNPDGTFVLKDNKHKKTFRQKRPDPDRPGKWIPKVTDNEGNPLVPVVPYRLPEVIEAISNNHPVLIVEGEGKADLLAKWNVAATCNAGGAKKWKPEHSQFLRGADVVLVPDHDNAGWEHVNVVGAALVGIAKSVRVLALPGARAKDDVIDWARNGGTREQLDALLGEAQDWKPPSADEVDKKKDEAKAREDELLEALAQAKGLEYHRQRSAAAKELGVSAKAIDDEIKARRDQAAPLYGHWEVEPWPEPADGDSLLRDIIVRLRRHIICSHDDALTIALWVCFAWVHDEAAKHSPILLLTSAEPESGKTTTLSIVSYLTPRAIASVDISEAALYRSIKRWQPSFIIDEFDQVLASDDKAELRSIINSGHVKTSGVIRCIGDDKTPEVFPTFSPKAIGMIGRKLPATTLGRCIVVELRRRKKEEPVEQFGHEDDDELNSLRRRLRRWSMDNADTLRDAKVAMPEGFSNRRADNWRVMLAIADLAGMDWGDQSRAAATQIEAGSDSRTSSTRVLEAIRTVFAGTEDDAISSKDLTDRITADPNSEWHEWRSGKPITQVQLARLLKPYGIAPEQVRVGGGRQVRGYLRVRFKDVWERYL